jgi:flavodoxin
MKALVIYDSKYGNTERLARAIGATLEDDYTVEVHSCDEPVKSVAGLDLLVVGGPTHGHGLSQPMRTFLTSIREIGLYNMSLLTFDTRFRMAAVLTGRAAPRIARELQKKGAHLLAPPESFFVERTDGHPLEAGETERAREWVTRCVAEVAAPA